MSTGSLLLTNALLTDPAARTQTRGGLLIKDGVIADLGPGLTKDKVGSDVEILDCGGEVLAPGLIDMREGLEGADIVMMLRLQLERMNGSFVPSSSEYFHYYGLDQKKLAYAKPDALVMHPGPMNRGVEIDSIVADGAQSLIREQVEMGVAVRMAVLEALARNLPNA